MEIALPTFATKNNLRALLAGLCLGAALPAFAGKTLDAIKSRGQVVCGVNTGVAGFSAADSSGFASATALAPD